MKSFAKTFGVAARNFTAYPEMPNAKELVEYGVRVEELGYDLGLGVGPHIAGGRAKFPDYRFAYGADRDRCAHEPLEDRHRRPRPASAQSGDARQTALQHRPSLRGAPHHGHGLRLVQARVRRGRHSVRQAWQTHGRESRDLEALVDGAEGRREIYEPRHLRRGDVSAACARKSCRCTTRRALCKTECRSASAARPCRAPQWR